MRSSVCICMLTYKRPVLFQQALRSLARLKMVANPDVDLSLLVVDNDAARSGQAIFDQMLQEFPFPARYVVETAQGIASARNRALKEAAHADFLALVDDDETVDPFWIDNLVTVQRACNADVVTGPVFPDFEAAPSWVIRGSFFANRQEKTGATVRFVETNNVLFRGVYARDFQFDLRFNDTSGEDTHFFLRLEQAGAKMVWAADARVVETISRQRTSAAWLVDRAQSDANRYTRALLFLSPSRKTIALRLAKAAGALGAGLVVLLTSFGLRHRVVKGRRLLSRSVGTAKALIGLRHQYYAAGQPLR